VLRLWLLSAVFFSLVYSSTPFYSCVQKAQDAHIFGHQSISIPLASKQKLIYSSTKPHGKILKYDKFLSLYLVRDTHPFLYPYVTDFRLKKSLALIASDQKPLKVKKRQPQVGLNTLAHYTHMQPPYSIISSLCCSVEGIVTPRGVIEKGYINHFLKTPAAIYGDIGIRVAQHASGVRVVAVDPYFPNNPFHKGDIIQTLNGKKVFLAATFMQKILFAKQGKILDVGVLRGSDYKRLRVEVAKRYGGGALSDTFMERFGLFFDQELHIVTISAKFLKYGLKVGDQLIMVNGVKVHTQEELRVYLEEFKEYSKLLFMRNNFEFFVKIK
jgi:hypothetical protein